MKEKTLTIVMGNARGGEQTWETLFSNLLEVYNSDLLLCFGKTDQKDNSLYKKANYIFEIDEYKDWRDYYTQYFFNNWEKSFLRGRSIGLAGGFKKCRGSGAVIFAIRHFIKTNCVDIINQYDRIILTRSDHFYYKKHEYLPNDRIWIVEGENYSGITDRHHIFPSSFYKEMLGVVEYMDSDIGYSEIAPLYKPNTEKVLFLSFKYYNILQHIERFKRLQFTVATPEDKTRWIHKGVTPLPGFDNLYIKYITEYKQTMKNIENEQ